MSFTQCIQISNQHNAHIKYFTILFVDYASVKLKSVKESQVLPSPKEPLQTPMEHLRGQFENDCYKEMEVIYFSYFFSGQNILNLLVRDYLCWNGENMWKIHDCILIKKLIKMRTKELMRRNSWYMTDLLLFFLLNFLLPLFPPSMEHSSNDSSLPMLREWKDKL